MSILQIKWPYIAKSIQHINNGLFTTQDIPPFTILTHTQSKSTIYPQTLPQKFHKIDYLQQNDKITLYIIILKNLKNKSSFDPRIIQWLNSQTYGFCKFSLPTIQIINDQQLFIEYLAYREYYQHHAISIYKHNVVKLILGQYTDIITQSQFKQHFINAIQFRNTRTFGFTKQSLLIPGFDYINYDPSKNCNTIQFFTYDTQQQLSDFILSLQNQQLSLQNNEDNISIDSEDDQKQSTSLPPLKTHLILINTKQLQKNTQLNLDYGKQSNNNLIKTYGYSIKNNPYNYLYIYISKYQQINMIYFSNVQRCTRKFKLYRNSINQMFISFWINIYGKYYKCREESLLRLINQMKKTNYPMPNKQKLQQLENDKELQYLIIYKEQQKLIYQSQISLLIQYYNKINIQKQNAISEQI